MNRTSRRTGAALLLVLWAITVLALMAGGLSFAIRQDHAVANLERDRVTAHCLARAGVERAIAALMDDAMPPHSYDAQDDLWADNPLVMQEIELTGGTFSVVRGTDDVLPEVRYGASDESAKLNLSTATREQLMKLPDMTPSIAGAIIDWRDTDEEPQPDGAERGTYSLRAHPYTIRNGPFRTVRELLLVRDVTSQLFYREDLNGNGLLDANEDDGVVSTPPDNEDGRLERGWFAYVTAHTYEKNVDEWGNKRVNINEADASTLMQRTGLELWAAESIVKAREDNQLEHLVDLIDVKRSDDALGDEALGAFASLRNENEKNQPVTTAIFQRIADSLTLKNDEVLSGRININTAPQAVLETLPGVTTESAEAIVRHRAGGSVFLSIGDLLIVSGITKDKFAQIEDLITVRTYVCRVISRGRAASGLATATIECVVDRGGEVPRILYWLESTP